MEEGLLQDLQRNSILVPYGDKFQSYLDYSHYHVLVLYGFQLSDPLDERLQAIGGTQPSWRFSMECGSLGWRCCLSSHDSRYLRRMGLRSSKICRSAASPPSANASIGSLRPQCRSLGIHLRVQQSGRHRPYNWDRPLFYLSGHVLLLCDHAYRSSLWQLFPAKFATIPRESAVYSKLSAAQGKRHFHVLRNVGIGFRCQICRVICLSHTLSPGSYPYIEYHGC